MSSKRKLVIIAPTVEAGQEAYPTATAIVTPRSPHAARGISSGARVLVMGAMRDHDKLDELLAEAGVAQVARQRETFSTTSSDLGDVDAGDTTP